MKAFSDEVDDWITLCQQMGWLNNHIHCEKEWVDGSTSGVLYVKFSPADTREEKEEITAFLCRFLISYRVVTSASQAAYIRIEANHLRQRCLDHIIKTIELILKGLERTGCCIFKKENPWEKFLSTFKDTLQNNKTAQVLNLQRMLADILCSVEFNAQDAKGQAGKIPEELQKVLLIISKLQTPWTTCFPKFASGSFLPLVHSHGPTYSTFASP